MARRDRATDPAGSPAGPQPVRPPAATGSSFLAALLSALPLLGTRAAGQADCGYAIEYGMNPSFHTSGSRAIVLADAFQRAREFTYWSNGPLEDAPLIPLGLGLVGEGWPDPAALGPGQRYGAVLFGSMEGTLPDGHAQPYVVTWRGSGHVRLEGVNVTGERGRSPGRVEVSVDPTLGNGDKILSCTWTATDPGDPVRDVHVWLPGMELRGELFWPPFLERVRALNAGRGPHTWRTLDWSRVNDYGRPLVHGGFVFDLLGAVTPRSPSQGTRRGVAPEIQVALCNAVGANLHFQVPHRAGDLSEADYLEFLTRQLLVIRDGSPGVPGLYGGRPFAGLDPRRTVTLELSNEIWNSITPVNRWMHARAELQGIPFHAVIAREIQLVFDLADSLFTGADAPRLRKFVGGFAADPGYLQKVLSYLRPGTHVDALGPAAYLGPRRADMSVWLAGSSDGSCPNCPDAQELLASLGRSVDRVRLLVRRHRAIALAYPNPDGSRPALELYEGGLNLKSIDRPWRDAARELQVLPEVFDLLAGRYVPMLVEEGVALVNWYSFMTDQDAPRLEAFGVWNDMQQELALPVARPPVPQGAPKAAVVCLGPPLAASCPPARATLRASAGSVDSFRTTEPVLGSRLVLRVDLRTTGHALAFVVGAPMPLSSPRPGGTLFADLGDALFLPAKNGPIATWMVSLPNDPGLAGLEVETRAFHVGGGLPSARSNAVDLLLGR